MKKVVLTSVMTLGLALGALGQGAVVIDNNSANGYLDNLTAGSHYSGPIGFELWFKNGSAADSAINSLNGVNSTQAYNLLAADGFTLATHVTGKTASGGVVAGIGEVDMATVNRAANGGNAVLGIVFWTGNGNALSSATTGGVLTFVNATSDYTVPAPNTPLPPGLDSWDPSLVMTAVPEPGTFALAGLGAAAMLIFRRRK